MSFIFQMDNNNADQHNTPSTSSEARRLLVDYAPKPVVLPVQETSTCTRTPAPRGIKSWLATHGSSYLPHDQPQPSRGPSPRRARPSTHTRRFSFHSDSESSCGSSDSELDDDEAIFLQPRRHLSRQSSAQTGPVPAPAPLATPARKHTPPLHLTAQRPALPVVDLSAASGHVELQQQQQLQSHWSDDESDAFSEEEELTDEEDEDEEEDSDDADVDGLWALHPDELEVPALVDDDESGPASTSTRSIPIPHAPARIGQGLMSRRLASRRKPSMDGQSFWTPWMDRYLADAAARA